jgi:hypothetical protein
VHLQFLQSTQASAGLQKGYNILYALIVPHPRSMSVILAIFYLLIVKIFGEGSNYEAPHYADFQASHYILLLCPNISLYILFYNTLSLCYLFQT